MGRAWRTPFRPLERPTHINHHHTRAARALAALTTGLLALGLASVTFAAPSPAQAAPAPAGQGFTVTPSDLAFILKQIKISEHHAATATPANPCGTLVGPGPNQIPDTLSAYGLRTVDGSCNNLVPHQETFAASDRTFPRLTNPVFRNAESIDNTFPVGPPGPTSYQQKSGSVVDSQPRVISNLIDDQTSSNPAAVAAAGFPVRAQPGSPRYVPCTTDPDPLSDPPVEGVPDGCVPSHQTLPIPNITTDAGLSPPYNSLFTFFGQFFDHGVDQTVKGGGTVFIPLKADDPLITRGPDGKPNTGDEVPPSQAFMVLTRAQNQPGPDGKLGTGDDVQNAANTDSPWVDQSQTYSSHASHQVFLREYVENATGRPVSTGRLLDGLAAGQTYDGSPDDSSGMSTWAAVKKQSADLLGIQLRDRDVTNVPMIATDPYGKFLPGPARGLPQFVTRHGLVEADRSDDGGRGTPVPDDVLHFDTPFVADMASNADPSPQDTDHDPATPRVTPVPDADHTPSADFAAQPPGTYDDEMLDAHFTCGDPRCNENIALTSIHHVFHAEHNRLVAQIEDALVHDTSGATHLSDWQLPDGAGAGPDSWNGERIFQAARFVNEMEYQHVVFEEFARKVAPSIPEFSGYNPDVNPAISAEFAQGVYRFGHSMLDEDVARKTEDPATGAVKDDSIPLLTAFLNPPEYFAGGAAGTLTPDQAAGSVLMGSSDQVGNEIDEFVTETLRNNLLGLPMDLAAINIARARETGIPPLNSVRAQIEEATNDSSMAPYESWSEFGRQLKHPESLVNFVAAYGKHPTIVNATTLAAKRAAARAIVDPQPGDVPPADAADFMLGDGDWQLRHGDTNTGIEDVDLWVGGLAEATNLNGGLLGSTFNYIFEKQLTDLQDGDRFYYLNRTPGMNLLSQLEGNSFAEMIQRNTDGTHALKSDAFSTVDCRFELGHLDGTPDGYDQFGQALADDPTTDCDEHQRLQRGPDGTIAYRTTNSVDRSGINAQSVYDGTPGDDRVAGGTDDDTFWGGAGNDTIQGNSGNDVALGGDGNDVVNDLGGDDTLKGGPGDDAVDGGPGLDLLLGGDGHDVISGGLGGNLVFGGPDSDFVIAGDGTDTAQGDGGDDWLQGGKGADALVGDHDAPYFDDPGQVAPGNDVLLGQTGNSTYDAEGGDDVMSATGAIDAFGGFGGFDWATHQYDTVGANDDMNINRTQMRNPPSVVNSDSWQETEAVSGSPYDDVIRGDDTVPSTLGGHGYTGCDVLDQAGIDRIHGLSALLTSDRLTAPSGPVVAASQAGFCPVSGQVWGAGNILLGGAGSDTLEGRGGDDIIDGDRALTVRISVRTDPSEPATEIGSTDLMEHRAQSGDFGPGTEGMTLQQAVFARLVDPKDLVMVRQIDDPTPAPGTVDTAVFSDLRANYDCITDGVTTSPCGLTSTGATTQVVDARGNGSDGTDTIRNIERLEFGDVLKAAAPTNVKTKAGDGQATVSWTRPTTRELTSYDVELTDLNTGVSSVLPVSDPKATSRVVTGLTNGTAYTFRVRAVNSAGDGDWSVSTDPVTPTVVVPAPIAPVLTSRLTRSVVGVGHHVEATGTVTPFQGVTVTLSRDLPDGTMRTIASTKLPASATSGSFRLPVPTNASGLRAYHVTVTGPTVAALDGPSLTLAVFRVDVPRVSPRGREFVIVQNTGRTVAQIGGWRLRDRIGKVLVLPDFSLAAGARIRVYTGKGLSTRHALFLGKGYDMWFAHHDTVHLYDARGWTLDSLRY
jgi:Ca2+-binding RTX toxin-like protein